MDRRELLGMTGLAAVTGAALPFVASAPAAGREDGVGANSAGGNGLFAGNGEALAETASGPVLGYRQNDIFTFKGVPYAATTAGENRFKPPRPPEPWTTPRASRSFGPICPQDQGNGRLSDEHAFIFQWQDAVMREDCLRLNLWSSGLDNARRPVMVWLHGGGFEAGSGHDIAPFDGHNLAARGDVVVVTINHRLNILGFLDLSAHGAEYAGSGNASLLDIVAALEWVRDNIAQFGGDPDRVTIFGQSGGGGKVSMLMGMPSARGLFHRAIVQSGSFANAQPQQNTRRLAALALDELGVTSPAGLADVPYARLREAGLEASRKAGEEGIRASFGPVVDGLAIPTDPWGETGPAISADVPMIIGTTRHEFGNGLGNPDWFGMTEAQLLQQLEEQYSGRSAEILAIWQAQDPDAPPCDLSAQIASARFRQAAIDQAAAKARQGGAPAWLYRFDWITPVLDGRPRAFHCAELPFVFNNVSRCASMTGDGPAAHALADALAPAWIAFARSGDPNHPGLPGWAPFEPEGRPTMHFDNVCKLAPNADRAALAALSA